jgi:hypothetical protein
LFPSLGSFKDILTALFPWIDMGLCKILLVRLASLLGGRLAGRLLCVLPTLFAVLSGSFKDTALFPSLYMGLCEVRLAGRIGGRRLLRTFPTLLCVSTSTAFALGTL